jgi:invasion protein IalB
MSRQNPKQKVISVRITPKLFRLAAITTIGLYVGAAAVTSASAQTNPPPKAFGPRVQQGQGQGQQQQPPQTIATHGDWAVQCDAPPPAQEGQAQPARQCGIVQTAKSEKNPKVGLTLIITKTKQGDKMVTSMRVMAPIGVFLPTGVALEIDGAAVGRVPFTSCMPRFCMALAEATPDTLGKMKKGKGANFIIYEAPGVGLPMPISLKGFGDALGELDKL